MNMRAFTFLPLTGILIVLTVAGSKKVFSQSSCLPIAEATTVYDPYDSRVYLIFKPGSPSDPLDYEIIYNSSETGCDGSLTTSPNNSEFLYNGLVKVALPVCVMTPMAGTITLAGCNVAGPFIWSHLGLDILSDNLNLTVSQCNQTYYPVSDIILPGAYEDADEYCELADVPKTPKVYEGLVMNAMDAGYTGSEYTATFKFTSTPTCKFKFLSPSIPIDITLFHSDYFYYRCVTDATPRLARLELTRSCVEMRVAGTTNPVFQIHPVPAGEEVNVRFTNPNQTVLSLAAFHATGMEVWSENGSATASELSELKINVSSLPPGFYFFRVITTEGMFQMPFVKK
jgi:hypothetical protein